MIFFYDFIKLFYLAFSFRFLVESMEISDEDVRIKETDNVDKIKSSMFQTESSNAEKVQKNRDSNESLYEQKKPHSFNSCKRKNFSRSQSVSMPKTSTQKSETNYSYKCTSKLSSLSNMSDKDLENWKQSMMESKDPFSIEMKTEEPILTLASSITSSSSVTIGFNVQDEKKEKFDP